MWLGQSKFLLASHVMFAGWNDVLTASAAADVALELRVHLNATDADWSNALTDSSSTS